MILYLYFIYFYIYVYILQLSVESKEHFVLSCTQTVANTIGKNQ